MKKKLAIYLSPLGFLAVVAIALLNTGCSSVQVAQAEAVGAALIPAVEQGVVVATDAYAVYQSANQNLTAANVIQGKLSATKVIAGAQAILGTVNSAPTQSLVNAGNAFVGDINSGIAAYKAAGITSPATITAALSQSGATTVTAIAALAPATTP